MDAMRIPPLRERLDDIPLLAEYFIGAYVPEAKRQVTGIAQQVLDLFQRYVWPGNIRELENIIRRAAFKGRSELIQMEDLPEHFGQNVRAVPVKIGNYHEQMKEVANLALATRDEALRQEVQSLVDNPSLLSETTGLKDVNKISK
jgi:transcriptional regulator with PAS, ATPase and Fis domain